MVPLLNRFIINKNSTNIIYQLYRNVFLSYIRENVTTALTVTTNSEKLLGQQEKDEFDEVNKNVSVLEELPNLEDVSHIGPPIDFKSFNFAPFADNSVVLQKLVDLGVDFYKIEQRKVLPTYLLQLNFEENIQPYIRYILYLKFIITSYSTDKFNIGFFFSAFCMTMVYLLTSWVDFSLRIHFFFKLI